MERTMEALRAQLATVERLEGVIGEADGRLRLLNARLDEAAARTIELSVRASDVSDLGGLGRDVDAMVDEMEALRQAIEATSGGTPMPGTGCAACLLVLRRPAASRSCVGPPSPFPQLPGVRGSG